MNSDNLYKQALLPTLSLFTSAGTLLCCALPALLVSLGMGAALASLMSNAPWLSVITDYKLYIFAGAGVMLVLASFMQWQARYAPCPADPAKAKACARLRKISVAILVFSILIYLTGVFFAFFAADLFYG
ncbi:MAG: hypothetical protein KTR28_01715 [Micavibrio sp.]|nr:hypothetical protein [Micavibrio sp.]